MDTEQRRVRITVNDAGYQVQQPPGLLAKALTLALGAVVLVVAFMFSVVALAVVSVVVLAAVAYLWWKTRDLRRQLRENPPGGRVFDGDTMRDQD